MDTNLLTKKFEKIGARATIRPLASARDHATSQRVIIDLGRDRHGEFFDLQAGAKADIEVLDLQPKNRHLVLMVRQASEAPNLPEAKDKFLCGHDERHWFAAAVPGASVSSVATAMQSLKPDLVRHLESGRKGKRKRRQRRKTDVFIRQGEWFFLPAPHVSIDEKRVLHNEPIRRGLGKPHLCEFLAREGGTTVYVSRRHRNALTTQEYTKLLRRNPDAAKWNWRVMQRDPIVYVCGKVTHSDHATVRLAGWHRLAMNTEGPSKGSGKGPRPRAAAQLAFLD